MTELVFLKHKQALTTSLKVAESFEKPHKDILEKIRLLSAVVHELYEFAVAHGCTVSEKKFQMNFNKLLNKTLGIGAGTRDELAAWQLYEVEKLQFIARTVIAGLIASNVDYHLPYKNCKAAFEAYAQLSYINERLLLAQRELSD